MAVTDKKYEYIINSSSDMITLINRDYVYEIVNNSYCDSKGMKKEDILGAAVAEVWGQEKFNSTIKNYIDRCLAGEEVHYVERFEFGIDWKYMHVSYYPYRAESDEISHVLVFSHDITKLGEIESKLFNYEFRDPVTGLFNERSLDVVLDMELEKANRSTEDNRRGLLLISIDNFQNICLEYDSKTANMLLENSGIRMKECLRSTDYVFRYNGNELIVLLSSMADDEEPLIVAQKILNVLTIPYLKDDAKIVLRCTVGIAMSPDDGTDKDTLLKSASKALSAALQDGQEFRLFDHMIQRETVSRLKLKNELSSAIDLNQFELHYQPIVDENRRVKGCETLLRWKHPDHGFVSPELFIPLSEKSGLISAISKWVLFQTCRQMKSWSRRYGIYTSVNLTAREYADENLPDILMAALATADDLSPEYLRLEITESETMIDPGRTISQMERIRDLGFLIYMDDFGTGHSSLSYLKNIPADTLKLDRSFIKDLPEDRDALSFLEPIIHLAENRRKHLIVEGVETEEQFQILKDAGCNRFQGYLFSPPLPPIDFEKFLDD